MDEELVERKKDIIYEDLKYLENKDLENPEFEELQAVKYSLQEAVEACIDIANHLIASRKLPRAEEYSEMFRILGSEDIIPEVLAENLADMASFRNLLVHRYGDIEEDELREIVEEDLSDIRQFIDQIDDLIEEINKAT